MPDQLQSELVRRAMARDAGQGIGALDPRTQNAYPEREDPFSSPDLLQKVLTASIDPSNFGAGGAGMAAGVAGDGEKGLMRFMVDFYKSRIKSEPSLLGHPGLTQVPEFRAAFEELNPGKKILGVGEDAKPSLTARLKNAPAPPSAASPHDVPAVAQAVPQTEKPVKTMLSGKRAYSAASKSVSSTMTEDGVRMIRADAANGIPSGQLATKYGMSQRAVQQIINGETWARIK